jgi:membrane fusion protein (multidrug efflux system)
MITGRLLPVMLIASIFLSACQKDESTAAGSESKEEDQAPAIPVETAIPVRKDVYAVYSGTAPIEAFADAIVIAKVGGEVKEIFVEEGKEVKAGQILARLDGDRLRLEKKQADANLQKLQRDYQRNVDLSKRGLISAGDFEKIKYEMDALEASYNLASLEYSYTEIRAPINGVVSERFIKVGNTIEVNTPTFQVTSLEPLVSYLHVPEREYRRIDAGQTATISVDAVPGTDFIATVARISPVVDPDTGTFKITVEVTDPSRRLKPGMFGRISIVHDMHANALQVPRSAIVDDSGSASVFVIKDDIAHRRPVVTGYAQSGYVEITDGLEDGEHIVTIGQAGLKQGAKVTVINAINDEVGSEESAANNNQTAN